MRPTERRQGLFFAVALAWVAAYGGELLAQERPQALEKMVAYRAPIQTAKLELHVTDYAHGLKVNGEPRTLFKTVRIAGDRHIHIIRGDQYGIVTPTFGAGAGVGSRSPRHRLECASESWQRSEDSVHAWRFARRDGAHKDLRTLGSGAAFGRGDIHDVVWRDRVPAPAAREYEESREGDLWVVRARSSNFTRSHWLDPSRGWSAVRVRRENEDGFWTESRSTLELMDGVWFPRTVHYFASNHCDGQEPTMVFEVDSAEFNRPDHPTAFTLADIGIDVGFLVSDHPLGAARGSTMGRWDGERVVSFQEYDKRRLAGEIREGPLFIALLERRRRGSVAAPASADAGTGGLSSTKDRATESGVSPGRGTKGLIAEAEWKVESQWEAYTRRFIEKHRLNTEQTVKAYAILKDCQQRANRYLAKREKDFEKLDKEAEALKKSDAKDRAQRLAAIDKRHRKLMQPIDEIFEKQLKPRLEKLPTRAQRRAAEEREKATSKPSKGGDGRP